MAHDIDPIRFKTDFCFRIGRSGMDKFFHDLLDQDLQKDFYCRIVYIFFKSISKCLGIISITLSSISINSNKEKSRNKCASIVTHCENLGRHHMHIL
jgi:hypothetical protein